MTDAAGPGDGRSLRDLALPLRNEADLDPLLERVGDARHVLIGEASHGTHEYYAWRAALTRRLIEEKGFSFVAVEGDWPDCYAVNECVTGSPRAPDDPAEVLDRFDRWPTWMWANTDVLDFTRWLREHNQRRRDGRTVGFYGLDVYSLWDSLRQTLAYLQKHHPEHVESAQRAFRCFEPYAEEPQDYAASTRYLPSGCEAEVVQLLAATRSAAASAEGPDAEARFNAQQNARSAAGAEAYYRTMMRGGADSWNLRDRHMVQTLDELMRHHGEGAKAVVWEHNTHVGDARWTDMADAGMVNVGQLVREKHPDDDVVLVGFGSYEGSVIASDRWGGEVREMPVPAARPASVEELLHDELEDGALDGRDAALFVFEGERPDWAAQVRDHRAIGVVYHPEVEHLGNYVPSVLGSRYDAFLWFDTTRALTPLHAVESRRGEPEAWPTGF
ncbi:erythromycin esterase family protein [Microbacterium sp. LRZ72]|uniref:erythromycin esterase family protein n=1 Tax=Microbacterium sp. LRZ72 TaxID=2942481 RepID=UPI0029A5E70B|nr:erythromycin esterase family protein [Microbacterium sp. LRZ72]MDX2377091.1 erythromycin esterase family protein [Microbacterium sp. LRZ72]